MKRSRRLTALVVALLMMGSMWLTACGGAIGNEVVDGYAQALYIITDGTALAVVNPFSPATSTPASRWLFIMIYDRLVDNLGDGIYGPALATSWETDDHQTFTMTLREDVYFHNGAPFTADDVVATVAAAAEGVGSQAHDAWRSVNEVTALDAHTVRFVLHSVDVEFFFNLSQPHAAILSADAIAVGSPEALWAGTGAFSVHSFSSNDVTVLARNDNYWGEVPPTPRITLLTVPEVATRTIMMLGGEAHVVTSVAPDDIPMFREDRNFNVTPIENNNHAQYIAFNMNAPIMEDINFRKAIAHAIYGPDIIIAANGPNSGINPDANMFGQNSEFRNNNFPAREHDLDRARAYLEASVWDGEVIEIATAIPTHIRMAEMIQIQLRAIGLETTINVMDVAGFTAYATYRDNQSQMMVYILPTTLSAIHIRNAFFPGSALNRASFNNPYATELMERASTIFDVDERRELYMYIQEVVTEYVAYIPIYVHHPVIISATGFGGMRLCPVGNHDWRYIYKSVN
jgi:peptide/nickel transport system substrate-binding protein